MNILGIDIERLKGHASIRINSKKTIYIDPYELSEEKKADIILITHAHYDHCSKNDIEKIKQDSTKILIPEGCDIEGKIIKPNQTLNINGIKIETVPAYNTNKDFHKKSSNWVGYIITVNNIKIYHAGDTDLIPEMSKIKTDIALVPIGGTYTMNAEEAAQAINTIKPKIAIPIHYAKIVGTKQDAETFKNLVNKDIKVIII